MKTENQRRWRTGHLAISAAVGAALCGCLSGTGESERSERDRGWESFRASATRVVDGREIYVVEWDIAVSLEELRDYYDRVVAPAKEGSSGVGSSQLPSTVNQVGGVDDVWGGLLENSLTYCVSNTFGAAKARAVAEMAAATAAWEDAVDAHFVYVPAHDANCNNGNPNIVFSVQPWNSGGACAFFPSGGGCVLRTLVMDFNDFDTNPVWPSIAPNITTVGVFRHELGHILGLRHEHTRPESGTCFEDTSWRDLTAYDARSVMHYNWCNGVLGSDLSLTTFDRQGVISLYGPMRVIEPFRRTDYNADGRGDIALTGVAGWGSVPVAFSSGSGTWGITNQGIVNFASWAATNGVQTVRGDFNADGRTDIALTGAVGWGSVPVAFSVGNGQFNVTNFPIVNFGSWASLSNVKAVPGDFNFDGRTDIALTGAPTWGSVPVAFSVGNGQFNVTNFPIASFATWAATANVKIVAGDFNGDGRTDIALTGANGWASVPVAFSVGNGQFSVANFPIASFATWTAHPRARILAGDFNGDGRTDLAVTGPPTWGSVPVAFSVGNGQFSVTNFPIASFATWAGVADVTPLAADFNADGRTDIALTGANGWGSVPVAFSVGNGQFNVTNFGVASFPGWAALGARPTLGDYNADGRVDIALTGPPAWASVPIAFSVGNGQFNVANGGVGSFAGWASLGGVRIVP